MSFNTAIARMMEFTNFFLKEESRPQAAMERLVLLLSPFAPHMAEELWQALGHGPRWPTSPGPRSTRRCSSEDTIEVPVQINGKLRGRIQVPADADRAALEQAARADPQDRRAAGRQDGRQGDRRAGADGQLRGEVKSLQGEPVQRGSAFRSHPVKGCFHGGRYSRFKRPWPAGLFVICSAAASQRTGRPVS